MNWFPDNSRLSPTENVKSERVQSNRPVHTRHDQDRTVLSCLTGGVNWVLEWKQTEREVIYFIGFLASYYCCVLCRARTDCRRFTARRAAVTLTSWRCSCHVVRRCQCARAVGSVRCTWPPRVTTPTPYDCCCRWEQRPTTSPP